MARQHLPAAEYLLLTRRAHTVALRSPRAAAAAAGSAGRRLARGAAP